MGPDSSRMGALLLPAPVEALASRGPGHAINQSTELPRCWAEQYVGKARHSAPEKWSAIPHVGPQSRSGCAAPKTGPASRLTAPRRANCMPLTQDPAVLGTRAAAGQTRVAVALPAMPGQWEEFQ